MRAGKRSPQKLLRYFDVEDLSKGLKDTSFGVGLRHLGLQITPLLRREQMHHLARCFEASLSSLSKHGFDGICGAAVGWNISFFAEQHLIELLSCRRESVGQHFSVLLRAIDDLCRLLLLLWRELRSSWRSCGLSKAEACKNEHCQCQT